MLTVTVTSVQAKSVLATFVHIKNIVQLGLGQSLTLKSLSTTTTTTTTITQTFWRVLGNVEGSNFICCFRN